MPTGHSGPVVVAQGRVVVIEDDGTVHESVIHPNTDGVYKFVHGDNPANFQFMCRGSKAKNRDLTIIHNANANYKFNQTASMHFKMQMHGPVVLVQQSKEASLLPRVRYLNYYKKDFAEQFQRRRRSQATAQCFTAEEFKGVKETMVQTFADFERTGAKMANPPPRKIGPSVGLGKAAKLRKEQSMGNAELCTG